MLITTNAIVISKLRYKDHDLIVKCYTQAGTLSFLVRGVLKSKKRNAKAAYFQLLSQLQLVIQYKENRTLQTIKEVKFAHIYTSLHSNVLKSSVVMFLSEVLARALKEEEENQTLYSYIENALLWLDSQSECANFHLVFLLKLTKYLGFYPDESNIALPFFNLCDGKFENKPSNTYAITGENLIFMKVLLGIKFDTISSLHITSKQRQSFLNIILLYFELHLGDFKTPKSLQIFNQVFN